MTAALCLGCGAMKIGALTRCTVCQAAPSGNDQLDILFSDNLIAEESLRELGAVIETLRRATDDVELRGAAFFQFVGAMQDPVMRVQLEPEMQARVEQLLETLALPAVTLRPGRRNRPQSPPAPKRRKPWWRPW